MPVWTDVIGWIWLAGIGVLFVAGMASRRLLPRLLAVLACWLTLGFREFRVGAAARGAMWERHEAGLPVDQFREGMNAITGYLESSDLQLIVPAVLLGLLAIWRRPPRHVAERAARIPSAPPAGAGGGAPPSK